MQWKLLVLGVNAAVPMKGRHPSAQLLDVGNELILIDCGEGTQLRMCECHVRRSRINHVFISHLHGDHIYGLPGLITSYNLGRREEPLFIYGPFGINDFIHKTLDATQISLHFDLHVLEHNSMATSTICTLPNLHVKTLPLIHRVPTTGYLFLEQTAKRSIDPQAVKENKVPHHFFPALQKGEDWTQGDGKVITNEILTRPGRRPLSYAYCSDTAYNRDLIPLIYKANLLYHESTFLQDLHEKAVDRGHSTAIDAASIAKEAEVASLLLGHFSSRYEDLNEFEREAKKVFQNTQIAMEGLTYNIAH
ncbi:MAG: ribonuclease Z [Saprospiraceae bacterium]|nr:ribonuclease Z [Saprospiraceae bacterium]